MTSQLKIKNDPIKNNVGSLYIHLPFCKKKCAYCDFVSYAGKEYLIDEYVGTLAQEIKDSPHFNVGLQLQLNETEIKPHNKLWGIKTIYFGGGTPTLLEPEYFEKILKTLTHPHKTPPPLPKGEGKKENGIEISIEANPATADKSKLKSLRQLGINRLSIGVQSFNNQHLQTLGRIHTKEEAIKFYNDAREAGFDNINLDLIFALPDQTLSEWQADVQTALKLKPEHISCYNLELHKETPLYLQLRKASPPSPSGRGVWGEGLKLPDEDLELAMYEYTIETLTKAGYKHYEISNFAKPGKECQHNLVYWKNWNYIGIGAGSHSHVDGQRWANPNSIEDYLLQVTSGELRVEPETGNSKPETIIMGLRLLDGLEIEKFKGFEQEVAELIEDGLLTKDQNNYKLTRKGLYLANLVFERFV